MFNLLRHILVRRRNTWIFAEKTLREAPVCKRYTPDTTVIFGTERNISFTMSKRKDPTQENPNKEFCDFLMGKNLEYIRHIRTQ